MVSGLKNAGQYVGTGMQLAGSMMVYVLLGYLGDRWLDTEPWLLVAGAVVGMMAFFVQLFRLVGRMNADTRRHLAETAHEDAEP